MFSISFYFVQVILSYILQCACTLECLPGNILICAYFRLAHDNNLVFSWLESWLIE